MSRKIAREKAMQALFQIELAKAEASEAVKNVLATAELAKEERAFVKQVVLGTSENMEAIDELIAKHAMKWNMDRIGQVEKAVLRLAIFELLYQKEVPFAIVINEAINLVKVFSTEKAAPFINGILDGVLKEHRGE